MNGVVQFVQLYWNDFQEFSTPGKVQTLASVLLPFPLVAWWGLRRLWHGLRRSQKPAPRFPRARLLSPLVATGLAGVVVMFLFNQSGFAEERRPCIGCPPVSVEIERVQDYTNSACGVGGRVYWNDIYDTYVFSQDMDNYRARWSGPALHTPPTLMDVRTGHEITPSAVPCPRDQANCEVAKEFLVPVRDRRVQVRWQYRETAPNPDDEPGAFSYLGRYPASTLTVSARLPEGVGYAQGAPDSQDGGVNPTDLCQAQENGYACDFTGLPGGVWPMERRFRLPFSVTGWNQCPGPPPVVE